MTNGHTDELEAVISTFHDISVFTRKQNLKQGLEWIYAFWYSNNTAVYILYVTIESKTQILIHQSLILSLLFQILGNTFDPKICFL